VTSRAATSAALAVVGAAGLTSALLLGSTANVVSLTAAGLGFAVALCAVTLGVRRLSTREASSAGVWFDLVPVTAAALWAAASCLQAMTSALWSGSAAVALQLTAAGLCAALTVVSAALSRRAYEAELDIALAPLLLDTARDVERLTPPVAVRVRDEESAMSRTDARESRPRSLPVNP
jgi:hypothetical protein